MAAAVAAAVFVFLPAAVERHFNGVHSPPRAISERARALHARLLIVDLHADSLLWGRDLLARGDRGHVDVPRMAEGNIAVQGFTVVTKTPRGQNIDRNDDTTDNVTLLAMVQRWPPADVEQPPGARAVSGRALPGDGGALERRTDADPLPRRPG